MNIEVSSRWKVGGRIGHETTRNERPLLHEGIAAAELNKEEQDVQCDQRVRDDGNGSFAGVVVTDGKHEVSLLLPVAHSRLGFARPVPRHVRRDSSSGFAQISAHKRQFSVPTLSAAY
jgi:hypothetical protein